MSKHHETAVRLFQAAKEISRRDTPAEIASLLNESDQVITNWRSRGVSKAGMLKAARIIGCSAIWLETGEGPMRSPSDEGPELTARTVDSVESVNTHSSADSATIKLSLEQELEQFVDDLRGAVKADRVSAKFLSLLRGMLEEVQGRTVSKGREKQLVAANLTPVSAEANRAKAPTDQVIGKINKGVEKGVGGRGSDSGHESGRKPAGSRKH